VSAVTLPTSGMYLAIDCDLAAPGIQSECTLKSFPATRTVTVGIVIANASGADSTLAAFNFEVYDPEGSVLRPQTPVANVTLLPPASWQCSQPRPAADTRSGGPGTATSFLSCVLQNNAAVAFPDGAELEIGTISYDVLHDGAVPLVLTNVAAADVTAVTIVACDAAELPPTSPLGNVTGPCVNGQVRIGYSLSIPTVTPTRTGTRSATQTSAATPTITLTPAPTQTPVIRPIDGVTLPKAGSGGAAVSDSWPSRFALVGGAMLVGVGAGAMAARRHVGTSSKS
jgi:hypothetical protein